MKTMPTSRSFALLVLSALLVVPFVARGAQPPAAEAEKAAAVAAEAAGEPQSPATKSDPEPEVATDPEPEAAPVELAPSGEPWLVDETGARYWVLPYSKSMLYKVLDSGAVRILGGATFETVGETDEAILLRVPEAAPPMAEPRPNPFKSATAEELAAADLGYRAETPESDRLEMRPFDRGLPGRGHWRNGFALADMNGDGKLDIVHGPPRKGGDQLRVFLGDGAGNWRPWATTTPSGLLDYGDVRVGDIDGDGNLDVVAAVHLRGIVVLLGDGKGRFRHAEMPGLDFRVPEIGQPAPTFSSRRVELLDWNRDQRLDVLALSEGPIPSMGGRRARKEEGDSPTGVVEYAKRGPRLYLQMKKNSFVPVPPPKDSEKLFGDDLAVADLDRDGDLDFVATSLLMGQEQLVFLGDGKTATIQTASLPIRPRAYTRAVAVGDFDGDRGNDIALSYTNFELGVERVGIDVLFSNADGSWRRMPVLSRAGRLGFDALSAGDADGDGALDLAALDRDGSLVLFLGDGKGKFSTEVSPEAQQRYGRCRGYEIRFVELDGQPGDELVASYADEPVAIYDPERCLNNGGIGAWSFVKKP